MAFGYDLTGATSTWQAQIDARPAHLFRVPDGENVIATPGLNFTSGQTITGSSPMVCSLIADGAYSPLNLASVSMSSFTAENLLLRQKGAGNGIKPGGSNTSIKYCRFRNLIVGSGGVALDFAGTEFIENEVSHVSVYQGAEADGGRLGNSLLRFDGNVNRITNVGIQGSVRTTWTNGRPLIEVNSTHGGDQNYFGSVVCEAFWDTGQDGYWMLLDGATALLNACWFEKPAAMTGTFTDDKGIRVTGTGTLFADRLKFLKSDYVLSLEDNARAFIDDLMANEATGGYADKVSVAAAALLATRNAWVTGAGAASSFPDPGDDRIQVDNYIDVTTTTAQLTAAPRAMTAAESATLSLIKRILQSR